MGDRESVNVKVALRFRPVNSREKKEKVKIKSQLDFSDDEQKVKVTTSDNFEKEFTFDRVFTPKHSQREIFEFCCGEIVNDVLKGFNGTIFAYGQTGSGKTFTILGSEQDQDLEDEKLMGFIPRVAKAMFDKVTEKKDLSVRIWVEYCEIYLDKIYDLFSKTRKTLRIRQSPTETFVEGQSRKPVSSVLQVIEYLKFGSEHRFMRSTAMNARSSRSHSVFTIRIEKTEKFSGTTTTGKFNLVDLAGSEKVEKTGAQGDMLEEAKKINQSLSALGNVINALVKQKKHIPYRNSPLTRILQDALGGNSKTTIICTCSPHAFNVKETISTMRFGERAKKIKCNVKANVMLSRAQLIKQVEQLRKALSLSESKNKALLKELKKLKGSEYSEEYLKKLLGSVKKKENTDDSSNPESPTTAGSFDEIELREELRTWQLKYEDKESEITALEEEFEARKRKHEKEIGKFKRILIQISDRSKQIENENGKLKTDMVLLKTESQKHKDELDSIVFEWKEKLRFADEDVARLQKEIEDLKQQKDEIQGRMSIYEEMGSSEKIKELFEQKNKQLEDLRVIYKKTKEELKKLKESGEEKLKELNESCEKRSNQCFQLLKKSDTLQKEKTELKKMCEKLKREKTMVLKMFVKEKEKVRQDLLNTQKKNIFTVKKYYEGIIKGLKDEKGKIGKEMENLKARIEELQNQRTRRMSITSPVKVIRRVITKGEDGKEQVKEEVVEEPLAPGSIDVNTLVSFEEESDSEKIKRIKKLTRDRIQTITKNFLMVKKLSEEKEKKNNERNERYFASIQAKEEEINKLKTAQEALKGTLNEEKEKVKNLRIDAKKKLTLLFRKIEEEKKKFTIYKKKYNDKTIEKYEKETSKILKARKSLEEELEQIKKENEEKEKQIQKLQFDLVAAASTGKKEHAGSIQVLEKKFGNKLDILNELRALRVGSQRLIRERDKYRTEEKSQREQLRNFRAKVRKLAMLEKKGQDHIKELTEEIKAMNERFQLRVDDKDRKIAQLNMEKGLLEGKIEEYEKMEEINQMFDGAGREYEIFATNDENDGEVNYDDYSNDGYRSPSPSTSQSLQKKLFTSPPNNTAFSSPVKSNTLGPARKNRLLGVNTPKRRNHSDSLKNLHSLYTRKRSSSILVSPNEEDKAKKGKKTPIPKGGLSEIQKFIQQREEQQQKEQKEGLKTPPKQNTSLAAPKLGSKTANRLVPKIAINSKTFSSITEQLKKEESRMPKTPGRFPAPRTKFDRKKEIEDRRAKFRQRSKSFSTFQRTNTNQKLEMKEAKFGTFILRKTNHNLWKKNEGNH